MRAYISGCIKAVAPFHVPKFTVVFPRHPRIAQALYNHQDALSQWAAKRQPSCLCEAIKRHAPEAPIHDGHAVASGFHFQCGLSTLERQVISGSSDDTFFLQKAPCGNNSVKPGHHGVPLTIYWDLPGILSRCFMRCGRNRLKCWHCEDHQPRAAVCYCPVLYHSMLDGTFCNKAVFQEVTQYFDG